MPDRYAVQFARHEREYEIHYLQITFYAPLFHKYRLNAMRILQKQLAVQELGNFSFWNAINKTS